MNTYDHAGTLKGSICSCADAAVEAAVGEEGEAGCGDRAAEAAVNVAGGGMDTCGDWGSSCCDEEDELGEADDDNTDAASECGDGVGLGEGGKAASGTGVIGTVLVAGGTGIDAMRAWCDW